MNSPALSWLIYSLAFIAAVILVISVYRWATAVSQDDPSGMIGQQGVAQETFAREGLVLVRGELWRATSDGGIIEKGDTVLVHEIRSGLMLVVQKL
ncbi:MAG: NfeD family protein [Pseudomonadota bacterium]|jgi:membrane protein implicated in regulation of membrane protease activity